MMESDLPVWPDVDYANALIRVVGTAFEKYRGFLILKGPGGFKWNSVWYPTIEQVKTEIDLSYQVLRNSIKSEMVSVTIVKGDEEITLPSVHAELYYNGSSPYALYKNEPT
jgi:hypothetical protein